MKYDKHIGKEEIINTGRKAESSADCPEIGSIHIGHNIRQFILSSDETKAYVVDSLNGLKIVDISDPSSPTLISYMKITGDSRAIALSKDETIVCIANGKKSAIIDVSVPSSPYYMSSIYFKGGQPYAVALSNNKKKAYIGTWDNFDVLKNNGLVIMNISKPTAPKLLGSVYVGGHVYKVVLSKDEKKAYVTNSSGLAIVDITRPTAPKLLGSVHTDELAYAIALSKDETKAYITVPRHGLKVVDISKPKSPKVIGSYDKHKAIIGVALSNDDTKAYVDIEDKCLATLDITNPTSPTLISSINTGKDISGFTLSKDELKVYINNDDMDLVVVDIKNF